MTKILNSQLIGIFAVARGQGAVGTSGKVREERTELFSQSFDTTTEERIRVQGGRLGITLAGPKAIFKAQKEEKK